MSVITQTKECINVTVSNFNCQNPSSDIVECVWRPLFDTKTFEHRDQAVRRWCCMKKTDLKSHTNPSYFVILSSQNFLGKKYHFWWKVKSTRKYQHAEVYWNLT